MEVNILSKKNSILNNYLAQLRDIDVQQERMRFRRNMERIGEIMAYEVSKELQFEEKSIEGSLGSKDTFVMTGKIALATILRAGLPFQQGLLNYFDEADNAFIGSFRKYHKDNTFEIKSGYLSAPSMEDKFLILSDPMLASGASMTLAYKDLCKEEKPLHTHILAIIAATDGIEHLKLHLAKEKNVTLWVADVDNELTAKGYIVPGLGDAGDLAFGEKE
ncbi:MAG: uracil phosphoribosyltransferase [Bacteroidota bacterium]|nr:uracil phosphoribosyltransferase [Bacteroidota bacterium]